MEKTPWQLAIIVPVGIFAIGFMVYTLSFFRQEHVMMLMTMLSDGAFLTILFHTLYGLLFVPAERATLLDVRGSRKPLVLAMVLVPLLVFSIFLHAIATLPLLNSSEYLLIGVVPLLLVALNRFF